MRKYNWCGYKNDGRKEIHPTRRWKGQNQITIERVIDAHKSKRRSWEQRRLIVTKCKSIKARPLNERNNKKLWFGKNPKTRKEVLYYRRNIWKLEGNPNRMERATKRNALPKERKYSNLDEKLENNGMKWKREESLTECYSVPQLKWKREESLTGCNSVL